MHLSNKGGHAHTTSVEDKTEDSTDMFDSVNAEKSVTNMLSACRRHMFITPRPRAYAQCPFTAEEESLLIWTMAFED